MIYQNIVVISLYKHVVLNINHVCYRCMRRPAVLIFIFISFIEAFMENLPSPLITEPSSPKPVQRMRRQSLQQQRKTQPKRLQTVVTRRSTPIINITSLGVPFWIYVTPSAPAQQRTNIPGETSVPSAISSVDVQQKRSSLTRLQHQQDGS